jgi:hypothetical protein
MTRLQLAVGAVGSGAPLHNHNPAYNVLFFGRKHWFFVPPGYQTHPMWKQKQKVFHAGDANGDRGLILNEHVLRWYKEDHEKLRKNGLVFECTQVTLLWSPPKPALPSTDPTCYTPLKEAGEVVFVPTRWAHATLNLQDSLNIALEFCPISSLYQVIGSLRYLCIYLHIYLQVARSVYHSLSATNTEHKTNRQMAKVHLYARSIFPGSFLLVMLRALSFLVHFYL